MVRNKKTSICQFNIEPYDIPLYICTETEVSELRDKFSVCHSYALTTVDESEDLSDLGKALDYSGVTYPVMDKVTGSYGVLVVINTKAFGIHNTIAHESVHVTDYIWQRCRMYAEDFKEGNEPYAYMVGWVVGKISDCVINNKKKCK